MESQPLKGAKQVLTQSDLGVPEEDAGGCCVQTALSVASLEEGTLGQGNPWT